MDLVSSTAALVLQASPEALVTSTDPERLSQQQKQSPLSQPRSSSQNQSTPTQSKSSWISVLADAHDRPRFKHQGIEVVDGTARVAVPDEILADSTPLWNSCIVGYFLGDEAPHIGKVHATVNRLWQNQEKNQKIDAQFLTSKTVLFRIENDQIRSRVLRRHCWHISDIPMVVQQWSPSSAKAKPELSSVPIWVDFRYVPDSLFSKKGLLFLGDTIGFAQKIHPNTERCTRLDVARVLVEVNLNAELPKTICLLSKPERRIEVSYPWLPPRCADCKDWGHTSKDCEERTKANSSIEKIANASGAEVSPRAQNMAPQRPSKELVQPSEQNASPTKEVTQSSPSASTGNKTEDASSSPLLETMEETPSETTHLPLNAAEHTESWTLVTRGKNSPGNKRMLRGRPVDPLSIDTGMPLVSEKGKDTAATTEPHHSGVSSDDEDEDDISENQPLVELVRSSRTAKKMKASKEINQGNRKANPRKPSSRKAK